MRKLPLHDGARGLDDDCAVLEFGSETLVITHDMMAVGTHFRADADMADVAWKLVTSNLSDLAAKGVEPIGVLLGHSLGGDDERFLQGLGEVLESHSVPLLGGDTIAVNGQRTFGLTAIGRATHTPAPSRSGARAGDCVFVTGQLGKAMLGFEGAAEHIDHFNRPQALVGEGQALAPHVSAMMDVSDGLLLDAHRMAKASKVTIALESQRIPVAEQNRFEECIRWGDDYQLLFTALPDAEIPVQSARIGTVRPLGDAPLTLDGDAHSDPATLGYQHRS